MREALCLYFICDIDDNFVIKSLTMLEVKLYGLARIYFQKTIFSLYLVDFHSNNESYISLRLNRLVAY